MVDTGDLKSPGHCARTGPSPVSGIKGIKDPGHAPGFFYTLWDEDHGSGLRVPSLVLKWDCCRTNSTDLCLSVTSAANERL